MAVTKRIGALERQIKRLEGMGSQSQFLKGLKRDLAAYKDGSYKHSFADVYITGAGRIGTSDD